VIVTIEEDEKEVLCPIDDDNVPVVHVIVVMVVVVIVVVAVVAAVVVLELLPKAVVPIVSVLAAVSGAPTGVWEEPRREGRSGCNQTCLSLYTAKVYWFRNEQDNRFGREHSPAQANPREDPVDLSPDRCRNSTLPPSYSGPSPEGQLG